MPEFSSLMRADYPACIDAIEKCCNRVESEPPARNMILNVLVYFVDENPQPARDALLSTLSLTRDMGYVRRKYRDQHQSLHKTHQRHHDRGNPLSVTRHWRAAITSTSEV